MSQPNDHPSEAELSAFEAALGALRPAPSRLDRDRLMFEAGQAAARKRTQGTRLWPVLAASFACLATGEAFVLTRVREPKVIERVVAREVPAPRAEPVPEPAAIAEAPEPNRDSSVVILKERPLDAPRRTTGPARLDGPDFSYAALRRDVLRFGLDALPEPPPIAFSTASDSEERAPISTPTPRILRRPSDIDALLNPGGSS